MVPSTAPGSNVFTSILSILLIYELILLMSELLWLEVSTHSLMTKWLWKQNKYTSMSISSQCSGILDCFLAWKKRNAFKCQLFRICASKYLKDWLSSHYRLFSGVNVSQSHVIALSCVGVTVNRKCELSFRSRRWSSSLVTASSRTSSCSLFTLPQSSAASPGSYLILWQSRRWWDRWGTNEWLSKLSALLCWHCFSQHFTSFPGIGCFYPSYCKYVRAWPCQS